MNTYELNKIAGAVLATALFIMGIQIVAGELYHAEAPEQLAYSVDVEETTDTGTDTGEEKETVSLAQLLTEASADKGANVMKKCAQCHTWDKGGAKKIGPNLYGVLGRQIAAVADFSYSDALKAKSGETWTLEAMDAFLASPKAFAKGTKMVFPGLKKGDQRADLLLYLRDQADAPIALPQPEVKAEAETQPAAEETPAEEKPAAE